MGMFECGIDRIYYEDFNSQKIFLEYIAKNIRKMPVEEFYKRRMFFVPNDEYLLYYFGNEILSSKLGIYGDNNYCKYYKRLIIPIPNFNNEIVGFCGYDNGEDVEDDNFIKYLYPPRSALKKERYLFLSRDEYVKAIQEDYIIIVDGMFDKIALNMIGLNAASIMSSSISEYHKEYLRAIKHIIVFHDIDQAGFELFAAVKKAFPNAIAIHQTDEWDADDYLKREEGKKTVLQTFKQMRDTGFMYSVDLTKDRKFIPNRTFTFVK